MNAISIDTLRSMMGFMYNYTLVLATVILLYHLSSKKFLKSPIAAFVLLIPIILTFASFPLNYKWYGMDYIVYAIEFNQSTTLITDGHDALFGVLLYAIRSVTSNPHILFAITSTLYVGIYVWACKRFTNGTATLSLFALCFGGPFFIGYLNNTLRAGLALALVLLAYSYIKDSRPKAIIVAVLAANIHYSALLPIIALAISYFYTKPKFFMWFWVFCVFVSFVAGSYFQDLFSGMVDDNRMSSYLSQDESSALVRYKVGFRWDFVLYSLIPIAAGWYYIVKQKFDDHLYKSIYSAYILANSFWVLVIRAPFSDRFAYLSWFLMPLILAYPVIKQNTTVRNARRLYCASLALMILVKIYI